MSEPILAEPDLAPSPSRARKDSRSARMEWVAENLYRRKSNGRFVDVRHDPTLGRQREKTLKARTEKEARKEQRALAVAVDRGEVIEPTRLTNSEAWKDAVRMAEGLIADGSFSRRTLDLYQQRWRTHLEPKIGSRKVQDTQAQHIAAIDRDLREQGRSTWTRHGVLTVAGFHFGHCVERKWILESPTRKLGKRERPKGRNQKQQYVPSPEEIASVIEAATPRWRPLVVAASHTAARVSELLALQWADIDWQANTIRIEKQLGRDGKIVPRTKSENGVRTIKMSPELRRVLREHQIQSGLREGFVFACESGRPPSYRNARKALDAAIRGAEIEYDQERFRFGFHAFRHAGVSALIRNGADPVRVARFVGDKVETVLSVYAGEWATAKGDDLADVLGDALAVGGQS